MVPVVSANPWGANTSATDDAFSKLSVNSGPSASEIVERENRERGRIVEQQTAAKQQAEQAKALL